MKTYRLASKISLIDVAPPLPGFDNFIAVYALEAGEIAIVDTGPSASVVNLLSGLRQLKIEPAAVGYVLATHIHIDHGGGIGKAVKEMPKAKVVVHERGGPHLIDPTRLWEESQRTLGQQALAYQAIEPVPAEKVITARSGMRLDLGGTEIEVVETLGHASHHLSFFDRGKGILFAGEAAGVYIGSADLMRPATPPPFNLEPALTSLDRLIQLEPTSLCYGHFGLATEAVHRMRKHRQQLLLWAKIIAAAVERKAGYEEMGREIREKDAALAGLDRLPPDERNRELYFINNSIMGFAGYFQRYGTGYLNTLSA